MTTFLIILIVLFLIYAVTRSSGQPVATPKVCKPHRWEYRKQPDTPDEYLVCRECQKTPTQLLEEQ